MLVQLDGIELVAGLLGALRIGAVPVPLNPLLPARDLAAITAETRARVAVLSGERVGVASESPPAPRSSSCWRSRAGTRHGCPARDRTWADLAGDPAGGEPHPTWDESPAFWLCTSGTTGQPKLAMHRHGSLKRIAEGYAREVLGIGPDDRSLSVAPLFHAYGLGNSLAFPLASRLDRDPQALAPADARARRRARRPRAPRPLLLRGCPPFYSRARRGRVAGGDVRLPVAPRRLRRRGPTRRSSTCASGSSSGSRSWTGSARPSCSTSTSRTARGRGPARDDRNSGRRLPDRAQGRRRPPRRPGSARAAARGRGDGRRPGTGVAPPRRGEPFRRRVVRERRHVRPLGGRASFTPTSAAATTCSRSRASGSRPRRSKRCWSSTRTCSRRPSSASGGPTGSSSRSRGSWPFPGHAIGPEALAEHCRARRGLQASRRILVVGSLPRTATGKIQRALVREEASAGPAPPGRRDA